MSPFLLLLSSPALAGWLVVGPGSVVVITGVGEGVRGATGPRPEVGEVCEVGEGGLSSTGDGFWRGRMGCADGQSYELRAVSIALPGTQPQPRSISPPSLAEDIGRGILFPGPMAGSSDPASAGEEALPGVGPASSIAPPDAIRRELVPGEPVKLVALSPEDAYFSDRALILGRTCWPSGSSNHHGEGWHGGPFSCWDGSDYYFFKVGVVTDPTHEPVTVSESDAHEGVLGGMLEGDAWMEGAFMGSLGGFPDGSVVRVLQVADYDPLFSRRKRVLGKTCVVSGALEPAGDGSGWLRGGLLCKKQYYSFSAVAVEPL